MKAIRKLHSLSRRLPDKKGRPLCPRVGTNKIFWEHLIRWLGGDFRPLNFLVHIKPNHVKRVNKKIWPKIEKFVETAKEGDPSHLALYFYKCGVSNLEWVKKVIERSYSGHPSSAAIKLYEKNKVSQDWVKRIIENARLGNPCDSAAQVALHHGFSLVWAKSFINRATVGNPSGAALSLYKEDAVKSWWAKNIILNDKVGNPSNSALFLYDEGKVDKAWFKKVVQESKSGTPENAASLFVVGESISGTLLDGEIEWAQEMIERKIGNCWKSAAWDMVKNGLSDEDWFEECTGEEFEEFIFE
jgi:hypothetical protein